MSGLRSVDRALGVFSWAVAALLVLMLFIGPQVIAEDKPAERAADPSSPYGSGSDAQENGDAGTADAEGGDSTAGSAADAKQLFIERCGRCHTLAAAGTTGTVGPSLDGAGLGADEVAAIVADGRGTMPAFVGSLDDEQIQSLADFVASASGS